MKTFDLPNLMGLECYGDFCKDSWVDFTGNFRVVICEDFSKSSLEAFMKTSMKNLL